jgi:hypothetical protein
MAIDLKEYHHDLFQGVVSGADANGDFFEDAFFQQVCERLVETGEL